MTDKSKYQKIRIIQHVYSSKFDEVNKKENKKGWWSHEEENNIFLKISLRLIN